MTTATLNRATVLPTQDFPAVNELSISGVKKQRVNETRLACLNAVSTSTLTPELKQPELKQPELKQPAKTKCLAEMTKHQKESTSGNQSTQSGRTMRLAARAKQQKQLAKTSLQLVETVDASLEMLMATKSVIAGLKSGETVVLISPERSQFLMRNLAMTGLDVQPFVESGKLIIFNSQVLVDAKLNLVTNYKEVFNEVFALAGRPVDRVVILKMDLLVNLESQHLANTSISKFTQAADEMDCKFIVQYSCNQSKEHDRLETACSSLVSRYFVMSRSADGGKYQLQAKNAAA